MSAPNLHSSRIKIGLSVDVIKQEVKAELDREEQANGTPQRLRYALQQIANLVTAEEPTDQLRCFVYIVSSLLHHERHGGLTEKQIDRLTKVALSVLQRQGIDRSSKLAGLYADLHLAQSQILRRDGKHWLAAWEQQLSNQAFKSQDEDPTAFQMLAMANRMLRLGNADLALHGFLRAEEAVPLSAVFEKARLGRIRALRLSGAVQPAFELAQSTLATTSFSPSAARELAWEMLCFEAQINGNFAPMTASVGPKGGHFHSSYVLEARLWTRATRRRDWYGRLARLETLVRSRVLRLGHQGLLFECVRQLDVCHDHELPIEARIRRLGELLSVTEQLITLDRALLFWTAAARWLAASGSFVLATLTLREYVAMSMKLSAGKSHDVMGQAADLLERPWFLAPESKS